MTLGYPGGLSPSGVSLKSGESWECPDDATAAPGGCRGMGSVPVLGTFTRRGRGKKQKQGRLVPSCGQREM